MGFDFPIPGTKEREILEESMGYDMAYVACLLAHENRFLNCLKIDEAVICVREYLANEPSAVSSNLIVRDDHDTFFLVSISENDIEIIWTFGNGSL